MAKKPQIDPVTDIQSFKEWAGKHHGDSVLYQATNLQADRSRVMSGNFLLDYALGGGFPIYTVSVAFGDFSSDKTTTFLSTVGNVERTCFGCFKPRLLCQCKTFEKRSALWVNAEGDLDRDWGKFVGASPENYMVVDPDNAEQAFQLIDKALTLKEIGCVVIDSVAALIPKAELDGDIIDDQMAQRARVNSKGLLKIRRRLSRRQMIKKWPILVLMTQQMRARMDAQRYQSHEHMPGGYVLRHMMGVQVRFGQVKLETEKAALFTDENKVAWANKYNFSIKKAKAFLLDKGGEYYRVTNYVADKDLQPGQINDTHSTVKFGKDVGFFTENTINFLGKKYASMKALAEEMRKDLDLKLAVSYSIIQYVKDQRKAALKEKA